MADIRLWCGTTATIRKRSVTIRVIDIKNENVGTLTRLKKVEIGIQDKTIWEQHRRSDTAGMRMKYRETTICRMETAHIH